MTEQETTEEVKADVAGDMCEWEFVRDKWEANNKAKIYRCPHNGKDYVRKVDQVPYCQYCGKRIKVV